MRLDLTDQEMQQLWIFLNRVQLQGNEAEVLVNLKIKIQRAQQQNLREERIFKKNQNEKNN